MIASEKVNGNGVSALKAIDISEELSKHTAKREELFKEEEKLRHDYLFRSRLPPTERRAAAIVRKIRAHEEKTIWSPEESKAEHVFPGQSFMLAKARMETTQLWKIVRQMPKGAMLHAHLEAMVDMAWLFDQAVSVEGICLASPISLDSDHARATADWVFVSETDETKFSKESIYSAAYKPYTPVPMSVAVKTFPPSERHPDFRHLFLTHTTITPHESLKQHEGINAIWLKFEKIFVHIGGLVFNPTIFPRFVRQILRDLLADNISWADIRVAFLPADIMPADPAWIIQTFSEVVEELKHEYPNFWGARIIYTVVRYMTDEQLAPLLEDVIRLKQQFPAVISGVDFVGHEEGRTLTSLVPLILRFRALCEREKVHLPLFLHAGETLKSDTARNLHDAILLGAKRIGHAFALFRHPLLVEKCKKEGVLCEICPISNEVLRLTGSVLQHPVSALLANGVPVAISCDDPGILGQHDGAPDGGWHKHDRQGSSGANGSNGLVDENGTYVCADGKPGGGTSHDFWQILQAFEEVGLEGLGAMAEDSVKWAAFEEESDGSGQVGVWEEGQTGGIRGDRVARWREEWGRFCEWVVGEFGGQWGEAEWV